jgi:hypothetical protein
MNMMVKDTEKEKSLSRKVYAKDLNKGKLDDTIIGQMRKQRGKAKRSEILGKEEQNQEANKEISIEAML